MAARRGPRVRHRHQQPRPPGAQPGRFPLHQPAPRAQDRARIEKILHERIVRIAAENELLYVDLSRVGEGRSPVPRRAAPDQPRARRGPGRPRRGHRLPRKVQPDDQRGGPPADPGDAERAGPEQRLGADQPHRRPDRGEGGLRLPRAAGLPDRLPHERRHGHARERDAAPAGAGDHPADRQGLSQPAKDQPGRARPVRRRLAGDGRLLPDQQPDHAWAAPSRN